ncbi:MAG TPA: ATP-binding protein [Marmoricola sp.]|jgi:serine/threonine-protein kinase RsbW|nr:ATP-binding protein [Marmoricola sp.]
MAGDQYSIDGLAVPEGIEVLHDLLERVAAEHPGLPTADVMMFETAVMELAGNVVEHGRPSGEVRWHFELAVLSDALEARLSDSGEEYAAQWSDTMPDELAESGRGLPLASAVLDELHFARTSEVNVWTMVRRYQPQE